MSRTRVLALAGIAVLAAALAVLLAGALRSSSSDAQRAGNPYAAKDEAELKAGEPNEARDAGEGPGALEEQLYAQRAYPATEIPWAATLAAQQAWSTIQARGNAGAGQWSLIGPSTARYPSVLTFSGQAYVTSGRITALAIAPSCSPGNCRVWLGAAGGGVWRTDNGLAGNPTWKYISASLGTNAIGSLALDPNDSSGNTIYAGTGEANASGDSEAGVGLYKSTNGGDSWSLVGNSADYSYARSIGSIAIHPTNPNIIYLGTTRGVRGVSSVTGGGTTNPPPGVAPAFGLYKTTNGGTTWTKIWDGNGTIRGVRRVALDPQNPDRWYASAYQQGIWRSTGGAPEQVFAPTAPGFNTDRTEFALTVKSGKLRIYAADGAQQVPTATAWRVDDANVSAASLTSGGANIGWTSLTSPDRANPKYGTFDFCTAQCWYDSYIVTPPGYPDIVYVGGSYQYSEYGLRSNGRGVVLSSNAGENWNDMTWDASSSTPAGLHPDHHFLVTNPSNPYQFFSASDGGLVRSSGTFKDASGDCDSRPLSALSLIACHNLLSRIPSNLTSLNTGLSTLQFQSLSASSQHPLNLLMGGTQDNGTFEYHGSSVVWPQIIYGDGGQSGFNVSDESLRFNAFFGQYSDVNFRGGEPTKWVIATGPMVSSPEGSNFYMPIIADPNPARAGSIFYGSQGVWRTQDWGGNRDYLEANCPEFTTDGANPACGDVVELGGPWVGSTPSPGDLTQATLGTRAGGFVAAIARARSDTGTLWAATTTGRVFISKNADANASAVTYTRLDTLPSATNDPGRFVSGITVDPANPNHAWISYSGYNFNTPAQPGHVFEVTYSAGDATWTNLDGGTGPMGDLPVTALVRDDVTGTLYAGTDFGVMKYTAGAWTAAGTGLPMVEAAGLTIVPSARVLYVATHGRSAWSLRLP